MTRSRGEGGKTLTRYLADIARFPLLDPDEERELGRRIRAGDAAALRSLVEANLRFVVSYASRFRGAALPLLDLVHEGNLGLMEAARRYDPAQANRFLSYAVFYVRDAILTALQGQSGAIRLPRRPGQLLAHLYETLQKLEGELRRAPSESEIARESGLSPAQVRWLLARLAGDVSLDSDAGQEAVRAAAGGAVPAVEEAVVRHSTLRALKQAVRALPPRERLVLVHRYGLDGREPRTLATLAATLRISAERVRQIENKALEKLRSSDWRDGRRSPRS
ncbi:MAG TPA: RNA polymerase sigma factor RpoD/SigA [Thermoanaerobaculia bacterium]|nr:RNA polymerase sigma factor RpoD/SigA [Thermoanaerobaculia bacterium]